MLTGEGLNLQEAIASCHPDPRWANTATFKSGDWIVRHPIDGCFVTPDLPTEAATWMAFQRCPGDHRFAVIDFKTDALVGDHILKVVRPAARRLSCAVPRAVAQYIRHLTNFVSTHQLLPRLHQLYLAREGDFTPEQAKLLQGLDVLQSQGMHYAEKRCRKFAMGNVDYSPVVADTRLCRWLWKKIVQRKLGRKVSSHLIQRTAKKCGVTDYYCVTLEEAQQRFEECDKEYMHLKQRAPELRLEFLRSRANNESGEVDAESQKAAHRQLRMERQRTEARHLCQVLSNVTGGIIA
jgi:hypothetical protein